MDVLKTSYKLRMYANLFHSTAFITPFLVVPFFVYEYHNWWLLAGILFSIFEGVLATGGGIVVSLSTLLCISLWIKTGFNLGQLITFYYFCLLFGFVCFGLGTSYENKEIKLRELIKKQLYDL